MVIYYAYIRGICQLINCSALYFYLVFVFKGFDPSGRVEDLANEHNKQLTSIAIGSAEGFSQADKAINSAAKSGKWVMLKNVHLASGWLVQMEKKLHSVQPHPNFRLFLTMEINPKLPVNVLRSGRVLVFEPPPGIKVSYIFSCYLWLLIHLFRIFIAIYLFRFMYYRLYWHIGM